MKKVITYGTYDLLHYGHIRLLERAKELGDYLIVGVTSDAFDKSRGKLNVKQTLAERIQAVLDTGIADQVIVEEYEGQKISDIQKYNVDIFTVGSDWEGKFDYIKKYCDVVYLSRTQGVSSTELRTSQHKFVNMAIVGCGTNSKKFYHEADNVTSVKINGVFDESTETDQWFSDIPDLTRYNTLEDSFKDNEAVYIDSLIDKRYELIMKALSAGCHVICTSPMFLKKEEAENAFALAAEKKLVLMEAIKTLYFPAFQHLLLLVESGIIGDVKDVEVSCSQNPKKYDLSNKYENCFYEWGGLAMMPIVKILGTDMKQLHIFNADNDEVGSFTRGIMQYDSRIGSFKVSKGYKSESTLVITGSKGYIYVPAPWWKTEYFEIRNEDLKETRKFFYEYQGEGLRYEILDFLELIDNSEFISKFTPNDTIAITEVVENFNCQKESR